MITRTLDAKLAAAAKSFPYKTREGGATVTVFVPYDCKNNCPFCVNKEEYADCTGFSLEAIKKSMETMDRLTPYCDFVFTGGEPLANLESLQQMLDKVSLTHKVYINTTLPVSQTQTEEEILAFLERNKQKITCLNISRHMQHFVQESNDSLLEKLPVRFRIRSRATGWLGKRTATVSRPAVTTSGILSDFGTMRVIGPGQKASIKAWAIGESPFVSASISSFSAIWRIRGLSAGRPLAAKIFRHAIPSRPLAPRP